jgi:hypothetical protein
MTLQASLDRLSAASDRLADVFSAARLTVCEDRPDGMSTLAIEELAEAVVEFAAEAQELRKRVRASLLGAADVSRADYLRLVSMAQATLDDIADGVACRIAACERREEVNRAARRGGAPWRAWWAATTQGLSDCDPAVRDLRDALIECWKELAEGDGWHVRRTPGSDLAVNRKARVPLVVTGHGDVSGRIVLRSVGDEPLEEDESAE